MSVVDEPVTPGMGRRRFLKGTGAAALVSAVGLPVGLAGPLAGLVSAAQPHGGPGVAGTNGGYGPLIETRDEVTGLYLLSLPQGFRYWTFGWTGDPMVDGAPTPGAHDGMAAFRLPGRREVDVLVRNHELGGGRPFTTRTELVYDPEAAGGTTNLAIGNGRLLGTWPSLCGTVRNCAGGPTPWNSWLTCEETTDGPATSWTDSDGVTVFYGKRHGYVFEVPATVPPSAPIGPIRAMGRFSHEAAAVDPGTNVIYETEDASPAGFYRFVPAVPNVGGRPDLTAGGTLEMLAVDGAPNLDLGVAQDPEDFPMRVRWVPISDPDPDLENGATPVVEQGVAGGAASFSRLEGAWWGNGLVYFVSTDGGAAGEGQVFAYDPRAELLHLVFESKGEWQLDNPDNVAVTPWGTLVLCEDGDSVQHLYGMTRDGHVFPLARNSIVIGGEGTRNGIEGDFTDREWAGATFSPSGQVLYVNIQTPGITFAITGPWQRGQLG